MYDVNLCGIKMKNVNIIDSEDVVLLWFQLSSFGKAFTRKKKTGSISDVDSDVSSLYADAALSVTGNAVHSMVMPVSPIRNSCSDAV